MKSKNYSCVICLEPITNPVCLNCYLKEINVWAQEEIPSDIKRKFLLLSILERIPENYFEKDICILCGNEEVTICSYCFFLKTLEILKKLDFPERTINSFRETFNYSIGHAEYHI